MSSITQLSIFHKNTDATATERGYEFQKLKTIETWLANRISNNDEIIYYDYQDDIYQRNIDDFKSTFRQLKLYSSNFSFASEEIKKSIIHFFTLYCLGEYVLDDVQFIFEANSNVARPYQGNDAKLLKKWHKEQELLEGDILVQCINKIKEIICEFINTIQGESSEILKAKEVFEDLKDNEVFWENFTKSIRWKFEGVEPEEAMANCLIKLSESASKLPYPLKDSDIQNLINSLHFHVSQSATKENPEERLLNNDILENIIFKVLGGEDEEYGLAINIYRNIEEITNSSLGNIYKIISWSRYYRQHKSLEGHKEIWVKVLLKYLNHPETPEFCKKDILYELIFLKLQPTLNFNFKEPDSHNIDTLSEQYFQLVPSLFQDDNTIEGAVTLYSILKTANRRGIIDISDGDYEEWLKEIETCLQEKILVENINQKCSYLESYSFLLLTVRYPEAQNKDEILSEYISEIRRIINLREEAPLYNFSNLYERINGVLKGLIQIVADDDDNDLIIEKLESLSDELAPIVQEREGKFSIAKKFRERGVQYLMSSRRKDLLKSLDYFHKSKSLLFQEESKESFILCLLNISEVYKAIGFNLAAKYYALAGFYLSIGNEDYFSRLIPSVSMIHHCDFSQGAWIGCMMTMEQFIKYNGEIEGDWDIKSNTHLRNTLLDYSLVLYASPILSNQTNILVNEKLKDLGFLKDEYMDMFLNELKNTLPTQKDLVKLIKGKIDDLPLNDLGNYRRIQFQSYNVLWTICFENKYESNVLGEEFCALFQILLIEMKTHFDEIKNNTDIRQIQITLFENDNLIPPEEIEQTNYAFKCNVFLPKIQKPKPYYPSVITIIISIFRKLVSNEINLSLVFERLLKEQDLGSKSTIIQPYDKLYKSLFSDKDYNSFMRAGFANVELENTFIRPNNLIL